MKKLFIKSILTTVITAGLVSCGGGSNDLAGIGGSGYVSDGTVTGFGSVYVNGVKFETNSATFEVEDNTSANQSFLRIGMVVQVSGSINPDGITGSATNIHYSDDIEGPVTSINENADLTEKTLSILGKTVVIHSADTVFEGTTYASLADNDVIEVSGYYDETNVLQASYVELKSAPTGIVEISGPINNLSGSNFTVQGVNVNATSAVLSDLENGLQNGITVEVKGTYSGTTINATEIEGDNRELSDDGSEVSVEGYITNYVSDSDFKINGQQINAFGATKTPNLLVLKNGAKVEAEGTVTNGILIATEIESRSGDAEVTALINFADIANNRFTVSVAGQSVTVQLTTATLFEDEITSNPLSINEIFASVGVHYAEVRGFESASNTITATRVKRIVGEKTELQGILRSQILDTSITVLDVVFPVLAAAPEETEYSYEDINGNEQAFADHNAFIAATTDDQSVVSIEDKAAGSGNAVGIADSVEIEIP